MHLAPPFYFVFPFTGNIKVLFLGLNSECFRLPCQAVSEYPFIILIKKGHI